MITIGEYDIISIQTGTFRLDGGAMFGIVPKMLWGGHEEVDEQNRILLATRTLAAVSKDRSRVILTDTGCGSKWSAKEADRFAIRHDADAIPRALQERFALSIDDVTDVIVTHLHFDHNGGLTEWESDGGGKTRLRFPHARHWIHREHWRHAQAPTEKDKASFRPEDLEALERADVLSFVDGEEPAAPYPGLRFFVSVGHTPYQLLPIFGNEQETLIFTGDVIPTTSHLRTAWVMAYDLEPLKTIREKRTLLSMCTAGEVVLAFPHDHRTAAARIEFANNRPFVAHAVDL